jgi:hypothetical protein
MGIILFIKKEARNLQTIFSDSAEAVKKPGADLLAETKDFLISAPKALRKLRTEYFLVALSILFFIFIAPKLFFFGSVIIICVVSLRFLFTDYRVGQLRKRALDERGDELIERLKGSVHEQKPVELQIKSRSGYRTKELLILKVSDAGVLTKDQKTKMITHYPWSKLHL